MQRRKLRKDLTPPPIQGREGELSCDELKMNNTATNPRKQKFNNVVLKMRAVAHKRKSPQATESLFLNLPAELRMMVYEFIIGDSPFLISTSYSSKEHVFEKVSASRFTNSEGRKHGLSLLTHGNETSRSNKKIRTRSGLNLLSMLLSCRLIYTELIEAIYSRPTFMFRSWENFVIFSTSIIPVHFSNLTSIDLSASGTRIAHPTYCPSFYGKISYTSTIDTRHYRNPILPPASQFPTSEDNELRLPKWWLTCMILASMPKLKRLRIDMNNQSFNKPGTNVFSFYGINRGFPRQHFEQELVEEVVAGLRMLDARKLEDFLVYWEDIPSEVENDQWSSLTFIYDIPGMPLGARGR